ncbi:hypothetical protein ACNKHU_02610 [Shigella flexneri]
MQKCRRDCAAGSHRRIWRRLVKVTINGAHNCRRVILPSLRKTTKRC